MAAATVYVALDLQLVRHISPTRTGVLVLPMAAGLALGAAGGSLILARARSVRPSIVIGTGLAALALTGLALTGAWHAHRRAARPAAGAGRGGGVRPG